MANDRDLYTAQQIATAARDLRDAAGAGETEGGDFSSTGADDPRIDNPPDTGELFSQKQVIGMLSDEIRLLRERGFSDERVADLLCGFDIRATGEDVGRYYEFDAAQGNQA